MTAVDAYLSSGWRLVPIPGGRKAPLERDWPRREYVRDLLLASPNIGVILGPASVDLVDVDLDSAEAIELAPAILPRTLTSGRASKPRSHRWYRAHGVTMRQYRAPRADGGDMLVELRAEGGQTVVPPSVHESGERIEWDEDDGRDSVELHDAALAISAAELSERVRRLACAALVMRHHGETIARRLLREHSWPRLPEVTLARIREWGGFVQPRRAAPRAASVGDGVIARVQAYLRRVPPAVSGQGGHAATFLVAQHLVLGFELDGEVALAALAEWNASCQPPWSEKELRHKIRQAAERGRSVSAGAHLGGDR